ncbi:MAG: NlpC/P60 family protein [Verrucomicrobiota bacterium]
MRLFSRKSAIQLWAAGVCFLAALVLYPLSLGWIRATGAALMGLLAAGLLGLCWPYRFLRWTLLGVYIALALFAALPGSTDYDRAALRQEVAQALQRYEGVRYVWGGEGCWGIDCSGLVRRGMIDGTFLYGARTLNPYLLRQAIRLWWHDVSAQDMQLGARGNAKKITEEKSLALLNDKNLHPGDFAITSNGVHALAYLGDHVWIEADPGEMKVLQVNARTAKNDWLRVPVSILRWRLLEAPYRGGTSRH